MAAATAVAAATATSPAAAAVAAAAAAAFMASQTLILQNPNPHHHLHLRRSLNPTTLYLRRPQHLSFPTNLQPFNLRLSRKPLHISASSHYSSLSPLIPHSHAIDQFTTTMITDSTQTIASILALAATISTLIHTTIRNLIASATPPGSENLLLSSAGPLFFAAMRSRPSRALDTLMTVVAAGLSKWLDIYCAMLMVRVSLSWFPNIPWDRQPMSVMRDMCDPYLNLFRNIIPLIFGTLDVSSMYAFVVLEVLISILNNRRGF